jgi:hypothetical protein
LKGVGAPELLLTNFGEAVEITPQVKTRHDYLFSTLPNILARLPFKASFSFPFAASIASSRGEAYRCFGGTCVSGWNLYLIALARASCA